MNEIHVVTCGPIDLSTEVPGYLNFSMMEEIPLAAEPDHLALFLDGDKRLKTVDESGVVRELWSHGTWSTWINPVIGSWGFQSGFGTLIAHPSQIGGGWLQSNGLANAEVAWDVDLAAGVYTVTLLSFRDTNRGIFTLLLDGVPVGTVDGYGTFSYNVNYSVSGIVVPSCGKHRFGLKMAGKNPSSLAYFGLVSAIYLKRTA